MMVVLMMIHDHSVHGSCCCHQRAGGTVDWTLWRRHGQCVQADPERVRKEVTVGEWVSNKTGEKGCQEMRRHITR